MKKVIVAFILSLSFLNTYADIPTHKDVALNNLDISIVGFFLIGIVFPILLLLRKIRKK